MDNENRLGGQMAYTKDLYEEMVNESIENNNLYGSAIHNRNINAYIKAGIPVGYERTYTGDMADAVQNNLAMVFDYDNYLTDSYFGRSKVDVNENTFRFNATYAQYFSQRSSLNAGVSFYARMMDDNYSHYGSRDNDNIWNMANNSSLMEPGIFAEYTYQIEEKFSLVAGIRGDYAMVGKNYYVKDAKNKFLVTPRAHIKWNITPRTTLRASAGMGYRRQNLVTDNIWMMTTSRNIDITGLKNDMEAAATFGGSIAQTFRLAGDDQATISFDYFRTQFFNTMVYDQETTNNTILVYNNHDRSYTDNFQLDFNWTPFRGFDLFATFRYTNAKMTIERDGAKYLVERPLTSRYKGLINIQYAVRRWVFDVTAQLNGPMRLPELTYDSTSVSDTGANAVKAVENPTLSPIYPMFFAQVSYKMSNLTLYLGCENIANYMQGVKGHGQAPILGGNEPYAPGFNSSAVWGPLMGRKFYIGLRLNIY